MHAQEKHIGMLDQLGDKTLLWSNGVVYGGDMSPNSSEIT